MGCLWGVLAGFAFVLSVLLLVAFVVVEPVVTLLVIAGVALLVRRLVRS